MTAFPAVPAREPETTSEVDARLLAFGCVIAFSIVAAPYLFMWGAGVMFELVAHSDEGVTADPQEWPYRLTEFREEWRAAGIDVSRFDVYGTDGLFNSRAVVRLNDSPESLALLEERLGLRPPVGPNGDASRWNNVRRRLPEEWTPGNAGGVSYLATPATGDVGPSFRVARDPSKKTIFVDYYFNF